MIIVKTGGLCIYYKQSVEHFDYQESKKLQTTQPDKMYKSERTKKSQCSLS